MKKAQIFMNRPVSLGLSILGINRVVMHEFWYDHMKPKHGQKAKLCHMNAKLKITNGKLNIFT